MFGWAVSDPPGATWWFEIEPHDAGSVLRHRVRLGPGPSGLTAAIAARPDAERKIIAWRLADLRASMRATVEGIGALAAEPGAAPSSNPVAW